MVRDPHFDIFVAATADIELISSDAINVSVLFYVDFHALQQAIMYAISAMERVDIKTTIECLIKLGNVVSLMRERLMLLLGKLSCSLVNELASLVKLCKHIKTVLAMISTS